MSDNPFHLIATLRAIDTPAPAHAAELLESMYFALSKIARGRPDCGRPLGSEDSRQLARTTLVEAGLDWTIPTHTEGQADG
jgi:hypothetical protein